MIGRSVIYISANEFQYETSTYTDGCGARVLKK